MIAHKTVLLNKTETIIPTKIPKNDYNYFLSWRLSHTKRQPTKKPSKKFQKETHEVIL